MGPVDRPRRPCGHVMTTSLAVCLDIIAPLCYIICCGIYSRSSQDIWSIGQLSQDSDPDLLASYVNLKSLVPGVAEAIDEAGHGGCVAKTVRRTDTLDVAGFRGATPTTGLRARCLIVESACPSGAIAVSFDDDGSDLSQAVCRMALRISLCRVLAPHFLSVERKRLHV